MPQKIIKNAYNAGELGEHLSGRPDLAKYFNGCSQMVNFTPLPQGGAVKRPGTQYIATAKGKNRLIPFEFSVADTHILEFGANYIRFYKDGAQTLIEGAPSVTLSIRNATYKWTVSPAQAGEYYVELAGGGDPSLIDPRIVTENSVDMTEGTLGSLAISEWGYGDNDTLGYSTIYVRLAGTDDPDGKAVDYVIADYIYEISTEYSEDEAFEFHYVQSADVMYIAHVDVHPQKLSRFGDTDWTIADVVFTDGPFQDENTDAADTFVFTHDEVAFDSAFYHEVGAAGTLVATGHEPFLGTVADVGTKWLLKKARTGDVSTTITEPVTSLEIRIKGDFSVDASGFNDSMSLTLERKIGDADWQNVRIFTAAVAFSGTELEDDVFYRITWIDPLSKVTDATKATLAAQDQFSLGVVEITAHSNTTSATAIVRSRTLHDLDDPVSHTDLRFGNASSQDILVGSVAHGLSTGDQVLFKDVGNASFSGLNYTLADDNIYIITEGVDADHFTLDDTDAFIPGNAAEQTVDVGVYFLVKATTTTSMWAEGSWGIRRGYPRTVNFHEDRLWWASNDNQPQTLWGSQTARYENYLAGVFDNEAVLFTLNDRDVSQIQWMVSKTLMAVGTASKEYVLSAANPDDPITPSDVKAKNQSAYGSNTIQPVILEDAVFFHQRSGKKLRSLKFDLATFALTASNASILNPTILEVSATTMSAQKIPDSIVWMTRSDGTLLGFTYEPDEDVLGWSRHVTGSSLLTPVGIFESIARISGSIEDEIWVSVKRVINTATVRLIERFSTRFSDQLDEAIHVDSFVQDISEAGSQNIILASDTVRCGAGNCNSSLCGGTIP